MADPSVPRRFVSSLRMRGVSWVRTGGAYLDKVCTWSDKRLVLCVVGVASAKYFKHKADK